MSSGQTSQLEPGGGGFQAEDTAGAKARTGESAAAGRGTQEPLAAKREVLTRNHKGESRVWLHFLTSTLEPLTACPSNHPWWGKGRDHRCAGRDDTKPTQSRGHLGGGDGALERFGRSDWWWRV